MDIKSLEWDSGNQSSDGELYLGRTRYLDQLDSIKFQHHYQYLDFTCLKPWEKERAYPMLPEVLFHQFHQKSNPGALSKSASVKNAGKIMISRSSFAYRP